MRTLLLIFAFASTAIGQTTKCPGPYHAVGTGCYTFPEVYPSSWIQASAICQFSGGYLVNIESDTEQLALREYLTANIPGDFVYWIGATDVVTNGTWRWVPSGETVAYESWAPGYPGNYDCASWNILETDAWYGENCCSTYTNFKPLCEADPL